MAVPEQINRLDTLQRLGASYTSYRLFLALGLFALLLVSFNDLMIGARHPEFYCAVSSAYALLCIINFLTFKFYPFKLQRQVFIYLIIDLTHLTLILFLSSGPNIAIILLFMVVVLASTMLLSSRQALIITLASIIAVVYQQFFFTIFDGERVSFIGTSSLITLVFLSTYALGQIAVKRLHFVESVAVNQTKAILQLQQINQNIIEQLDTGFVVLSGGQGQIITLNDAARNLLKISEKDLQRSPSLEKLLPELYRQLLIHSLQHFRGIFQFSLDQESGLSIQYRPITTQQQQLTLLIIESLDRINQQVQQLKLASIGQLSASIAHEIRNPLAAISQANELLEEDIGDDQKVLTQMIQKQCLRINRTIEDTLSMSRQNQTIPELIVFYPWLKEFIAEDLTDIQRFLRLTIEDGTKLCFDPHQLRLVLINLIRNAIRHGHEHQPDSRVDIRAHRAGDMTFIDIIDQGTGVPDQQQNNLFEPFHSTATNGTGLGLYLSKTFCEANHARLKYIPQTQGACFRIECHLMENT